MTRANYFLRAIPPHLALEFASNHTVFLRSCLQRILGAEIPAELWEVAVLPLSFGGLGLRSGSRVSPAACWSSWADCLVTTAKRQAVVAELLVAALTNEEPGSCLVAAADARCVLLEAGFHAPGWRDFVSNHPPRPGHNNMARVTGCLLDVSGGTVCELEFVAAPHAPVPCFVPVPGRPNGEFAFHQLPCRPSLPVRFTAVLRRLWLPLPPLCVLAGVACHSTLVATTAALGRGGSWWRVQPHGFAVRQGQSVGERPCAGHGFGPSGDCG